MSILTRLTNRDHANQGYAHPAKWHLRLLLTILLIYGLIAAWYSVMIPPGEGVDEAAHLDYILFLKAQQRLPIEDPAQGRIDAIMGHHPPLYYALGATLIAPIDTSDRAQVLLPNPHFVWSERGRQGWNVVMPSPHHQFPWSGTILALHILRFFSVALGGLALLVVYLSAKQLLPRQQWAALGATALVGLNPAFLFMSSTVHHDVLLVMLNSAALYWSIRFAANPVTRSALYASGVLMGATILTKVSGLTIAPIVMLVLLLRPSFRRDWQNRFRQILLVGMVAFVCCSWWFARNQIIYGDPLGANVYTQIFQANMRPTPFTWGIFVHEFLAQMSRTFWGAFGFMHILLPIWTRIVLWGITGIGIAGWCIIFVAWLFTRTPIPPAQRVAWFAILLFFITLFGFYVRIAASTLGAGHGRYLFPAIIPIGAIIIGGLHAYSPSRYQRWITLAIVLGMTFYAVAAPAYYVWPKYAIPASVPETEIAQATPIHSVFEGGIELVAAKSSSMIVIPGQALEITTYWTVTPRHDGANATSIPDVYVHLSLVNDQPALIAATEFWPEISTTPAVWGNRIIANTQSFYFPPNQESGNLLVQVEVKAGKGGETLLPIGASSGQGQTTILKLLALGAVAEVPTTLLPQAQRQEVFAQTIRLVAAPIPERITAGELLPVILYWQVLEDVTQDYTIFIHVLNQEGEIVAQLDRPPGGGTSPTSTWQPGQVLQDTYPVLLPESLPPGPYQVRLGMYTWPDLTRQPIMRGNESAGDTLIIGNFSVVEDTPSQ